jgi:hypothetical protein
MAGEQVKVPGVGNVSKKYLTWGAVIGMAGTGYLLFRKHSANVAAASGTYPAAAAADPNAATTDPYASADPYGVAGGLGYDPYASAGTQGVGNGVIIGYDSHGQAVYGSSNTAAATLTESQWIAQAAGDLQQYSGATYAQATSALTKWVAGQPITEAEAVLVREATHIDGDPPNGAPPLLITPNPTPTPTPTVTGKGPIHGLHLQKAYRNSVTVAWTAVPGSHGYIAHGQHTPNTTTNIAGLKRNTAYTINVASVGSDGKSGPSSSINVRTAK